MNAFEQVKNALSRMTDKEAKAAHRKMLDTERLLLRALAEIGYSYKGGKVTRVKKEAEKEQESVEKDGEVRYNRGDGKYTEKDYRDYGWLRANELITANENLELTRKFAEAVYGNKYQKSKFGEWMIPIGKDFGKIVFAKGTIDNPVYTKMVEIDADIVDRVSDWEVMIYASNGRGIEQESGDIFRRYNSTDYAAGYKEYLQRSSADIYGNRLQRGRSGGKTNSPVEYHFDGDGHGTVTYSDGTVVHFSRATAEKVEAIAKQHFGTTDAWKETGYLLRDGTQLDFSGAHWLRDYGKEYVANWKRQNGYFRQVDHEDIFEAFEKAGENPNGDNRLKFLNMGNIRVSPESPGINLSVMPTEQQFAKLKEFIRQNNMRGFHVDFNRTNQSGTAFSKQYDPPTSADAIIEDIRSYFENGSESTSDLMRFHNARFSRVTPEQDRAYTSLAEKYQKGTATKEETKELERMVEEAAREALPLTIPQIRGIIYLNLPLTVANHSYSWLLTCGRFSFLPKICHFFCFFS